MKLADFRYWHKADMARCLTDVRFWGNSGHRRFKGACPLLTHCGHERLMIAAMQTAPEPLFRRW
jgi:hypothetical protein